MSFLCSNQHCPQCKECTSTTEHSCIKINWFRNNSYICLNCSSKFHYDELCKKHKNEFNKILFLKD